MQQTVNCEHCPLSKRAEFRRFNGAELSFISKFKVGELAVEPGASVLVEGAHSAHLYTVLTGWMFRHKLLEDGRRQVLNYALPGDLLGLQGSLLGEMEHSVEALVASRLCVFEKDRLDELFREHATLAFDLTWIASREERMLDENLLSVGRRTAIERAAYLLAFLTARAKRSGVTPHRNLLPLTQQHVADTLGLSLVHTNKTLRKLAARGLIVWKDRGCEVKDAKELAALADWEESDAQERPFI